MRGGSRKGLVYSIIAIMLFSLLVVLTLSQSALLNTGERSTVNKLSSDFMISFVSTVDRDYDKALDVSSRRAIVSAVNHMINGTILPDAEATLEELITNGTINGTAEPLMDANTISYWLSNMQARGLAAGLDVKLQMANFSVSEYDSFDLLMNATISLNVSSPGTRASVSRILHKSAVVSIENFTDPFYSFETAGLIPRTISISPYSNYSAHLVSGQNASGAVTGWTAFAANNAAAWAIANKSAKILVVVNGSAINSTTQSLFAAVVTELNVSLSAANYLNGAAGAVSRLPDGSYAFLDATSRALWNKTALDRLDDTINEEYYVASSGGPGFLDRLELHFNNTRVYGLETIVSLPELQDKSLPAYSNTTLVDYLYFQNATVAGKGVRGLYYTWFKVDAAHEALYGVTAANRTLTT